MTFLLWMKKNPFVMHLGWELSPLEKREENKELKQSFIFRFRLPCGKKTESVSIDRSAFVIISTTHKLYSRKKELRFWSAICLISMTWSCEPILWYKGDIAKRNIFYKNMKFTDSMFRFWFFGKIWFEICKNSQIFILRYCWSTEIQRKIEIISK